MRFAHRTLRAIGGAAMVGALVLGTASAASADATRDDQWQNKAFDIDAVHKVATGKGVTVAVLDDGVDGTHPDLTGNVLAGKRCSDGKPANKETLDDHGSGMASLIAGHGHGAGGNEGVLGLAPDAKILPIDIFSDEGRGLTSGDHQKACEWDEAVRYAVDQGADVISISISQDYADEKDKQAIAYALAHNVVVVQASGNDGTEEKRGLGSVPGVTQVGGSVQSGTPWEDENYSKQLMFTAPAKAIIVATGQGGYEADGKFIKGDYVTGDGTSMSAAITSGTFALLKQKYPDYTPGQLVNRVIKSTYIAKGVDKSKLPDAYHGYGDLSPLKALTANIPKGGADGPWDLAALPKASGDKAGGASAPATDNASSAAKDDDSSNVFLYVGIGIAALVIIIVVIVVIVIVSRNKNNRGGPGGPGAPGTMPPHAYQQGGYPPQPPQQQPGPYGQQQPPQWGPPRQ